ncbi:MAG: alanine--tRNA ligase [Candidatus Portnoybacteria bacterium RIFCSPLOWO2_12_FULL_39_9]|uniref:Alanine--tRNA ligase n=1 Tax=Candidatus Portnoybacteria bacterium RIFCSPHIGHO2_12_FULL_38_9 TaxID=1801997 RepID=A0A1G2FEL2_9BACT|nr:MAG: alanine--tRNA ligase [Candidatus Portnoybacteria bacterium RIFCSPHIGHO2_12_FULL_38_9]OGZ37072.1 MAG: alanine--tRNA ligase [Candidatus Portnoybacteria bacterium RIFCSPHIGHO2_02_FULL_39_12]OGZ41307.1 MAG: alanine--tRNA ligase [Candidatus Portnoybacteria bacterium RIFCSPLOWO2_12_FULL_39_9]
MTSQEIREKFLKFFENKGHTIVPSSSLIPDDPSVLLTTAGMQQFAPYLSGQVKPPYKRACSIQKCFRTVDIDEVGDETHHTFFEMLGNWSFGDYFKKGAIDYALDFLISELKIPIEKLWFTVFKGENNIPKDEEAIDLWMKKGIPKEKIFEFGLKDNFWGPTGLTGPCGPCSEIHYERTEKPCSLGKKCGPNCDCGRFVEIWNLVFMEYHKNEKGEYETLPQKNIDTGIGFERLTAILQNKKSGYETDLFLPIMEEISGAKHSGAAPDLTGGSPRMLRIIADHIRGACFLIADGVLPSNIEQGYILRRILRRIIGQGKILNLGEGLPKGVLLPNLAKKVIGLYGDIYPELKKRQVDILTVIQKEEEKFGRALENGLREFGKISHKTISGQEAFNLFSTYGFPLELTKELAKEKGLKVDERGFQEELKKHQEISRAGLEKKFGGHGLGETRVFSKKDEEKIKKLHTATHLLHQALRDVLGEQVKQMGSDINPERLRFDFSYPEKMTLEQIKKVEELVNQKIKENLPVKMEEMDKGKALKSGALSFFKEKYGERIKVYSVGGYSKEICAGPHVERTKELGGFKIKKEQSSSAEIRRIKAVLE